MPRRKRNRGWFRKRHDKRRRKGFTVEECKRGYANAKKKLASDPEKYAWLWRRIRGYFRAKGTWYPQLEDRNGQEEDRDGGEDAAPDIPF